MPDRAVRGLDSTRLDDTPANPRSAAAGSIETEKGV